VDVHGLDLQGQAHSARSGQRCGRRTRRDYPGLRLRGSAVIDRHRTGGRLRVLRGRLPADKNRCG
jgi:hypothetical protein